MERTITGRIWRLGDDIDTDVIMPTQYIALPTIEESKRYAFEPLRPDLAEKIMPGDIIVAGKNFGCGSSRENAAAVLKALGLGCIIAKSFAKIFFRNAINNGILLIESQDLYDNCQEGDTVVVEPGKQVTCGEKSFPIPSIPENVLSIVKHGGLVASMQVRNRANGGIKHARKEMSKRHIPGKTLAEQIIINNTGADCKPGDIVTVQVDMAILHDIYAPHIFNQFHDMGFTQVFDTRRAVMMLDHLLPTCMEDDPRCFRYSNRFQDELGLETIHQADGICHQVVAEEGYAKPGEMVFGTDSHTTSYGALGAFATGVGYTQMASILGTGEIWIRVPSAIMVQIDGKLPEGVFAKDIILRILGDIKADGAIYKSLEFCGSTIDDMSISARLSIANMSVECGAKSALFAPDEKTADFLGIDPESFSWQRFDNDAVYERVLRYNAAELEPYMACPNSVDNVRPVEKELGVKVDEVFLGSCTNGRLEDLAVAASILEGKTVDPYVKFIVTPASKKVYREAMKLGYIQTLISAGAMLTHPYCSLCQGRSGGVASDGEVVIGTHNRNFIGRLGSPGVKAYLASPATAAAAALAGEIVDPRGLVEKH